MKKQCSHSNSGTELLSVRCFGIVRTHAVRDLGKTSAAAHRKLGGDQYVGHRPPPT